MQHAGKLRLEEPQAKMKQAKEALRLELEAYPCCISAVSSLVLCLARRR